MRIKILAGLAVALAVCVGGAQAQAWPNKPIKLIVPFAPGGPTDQLARHVGSKLAEALGQAVVVENVVGAGGSVGLDRLAKSAPDGYTIGASANTLQAIAPHLGPLPYDTVKSFTPIGTIAGFPFALMVGPSSPFNSVSDLLARARQRPGEVSSASAGVGTGQHLAALLLSQRTGVTFNAVQYKGAAPVMNDIMGGHADFAFEVIGSAMPIITGGKARVIATTDTARHPLLPNVPTVAETVPGFDIVGWFALFGPANLPADITRKINDELGKIHRSDDFKKYLEVRGYQTLPGSAADLATRAQTELVKWGEVVKAIPASALGR